MANLFRKIAVFLWQIIKVALLLVVLNSLPIQSSDEAYGQFERTFQELYGRDSSPFEGLGSDGYAGRWLSDEELSRHDCAQFELCQFVELATVHRCSNSSVLNYSAFAKTGKVVGRFQLGFTPIEPGKTKIIEIGNKDTGIEITYQVDSVICSDEDFSL